MITPRYSVKPFSPGLVGVWDTQAGDFVKNPVSLRRKLFHRRENAEKQASKLNQEEHRGGRDEMTTFGKRLQELRKEQGISQRDLAKQIGVGFTHISKVEHGSTEYPPSDQMIYRLSHALDTDAEKLFCLAGKVPHTLKTMLKDNPLLAELVRVLSEKRLPDEVYRQLIEIARKDEQRGTP